jgi:hypothetical protein
MRKSTTPTVATKAKKAPVAPAAKVSQAGNKPSRKGNGKPPDPREVYERGKICKREFQGYNGQWEIVQMKDGRCHVFYLSWDWSTRSFGDEQFVSTHPTLAEAMKTAASLLAADDKKCEAIFDAAQKKNGAKRNGRK